MKHLPRVMLWSFCRLAPRQQALANAFQVRAHREKVLGADHAHRAGHNAFDRRQRDVSRDASEVIRVVHVKRCNHVKQLRVSSGTFLRRRVHL